MKRNDPFWISRKELEFARAYCKRYNELKAIYATMDGRKGVAYDGDGIHAGISDPTMEAGDRRARISRKIEVIEKAAHFANNNLWAYVLLYITDDRMTFEKLRERGFPLGKNILTRIVRKAYWYVSEEA